MHWNFGKLGSLYCEKEQSTSLVVFSWILASQIFVVTSIHIFIFKKTLRNRCNSKNYPAFCGFTSHLRGKKREEHILDYCLHSWTLYNLVFCSQLFTWCNNVYWCFHYNALWPENNLSQWWTFFFYYFVWYYCTFSLISSIIGLDCCLLLVWTWLEKADWYTFYGDGGYVLNSFYKIVTFAGVARFRRGSWISKSRSFQRTYRSPSDL